MGSTGVIDDELASDSPKQDDICGDIYNLSGTLVNLLTINSKLLGEARNNQLRRMKQVIFDNLVVYVDCLALEDIDPESAGEDIADYNGEDEEY